MHKIVKTNMSIKFSFKMKRTSGGLVGVGEGNGRMIISLKYG